MSLNSIYSNSNHPQNIDLTLVMPNSIAVNFGKNNIQTISPSEKEKGTPSFRDILSGEKAFYNRPDYLESTKQDFAKTTPLDTNYTWNSENIIKRIAKQIFSVIFFPLGIYHLLHAAGGPSIVPATGRAFLKTIKKLHTDGNISLENTEWKYKRITVEVDGYKVDAMILGKASTLNNGRWVLASNGSRGFYEKQLTSEGKQSCDGGFKQILTQLNGNGIIFNYPGVGSSSGIPNREAMAKAYRAILNLLEDEKKGIGAKEIVGYGFSIGCGVQADALMTHDLKENIKYVFVKRQPFSNLRPVIAAMTSSKLKGLLVKALGWNINCVESSRRLKAPEIIMQTATVDDYEVLHDSSKIIGDGVIPSDSSLGKILLDEGTTSSRENKVFIGMKEDHNSKLTNTSFLTNKIKELLKSK